MRKIVNIIFVALCSVALFSCTKESSLDGEGKISFTITTDPLIETKAFPESDNALRENQINRIDYFIYKNGDYSQAALSGRLDTDAVHEKKFIVDVAGVDYNDLVSAGAPLLYAVVNLPENVRIPATASLEAVKNSVVVANFLRDTQNGFLMSGEMALTLNAAGADCHIVVERVAAKVSFNITTDEFVYEDEADPTSTKWYSHPEAMKVEFMNLGSQAVVKGGASAVSNTGIFDYPEERLRNQYYTYPREWDYGMDDEPYVFITLPVTKGSFDGERRDCYYKAVFTNKSFESNHWYKYTLSLKMLGSFEREVPQVPTPEDAVFFVYQWGGKHGYDGNATEGQITGFRYLMVEDNSPTKVYYMYNTNTLDLPFKTSHDCIIDNKVATSPNFKGTNSNSTFNRASDISVAIDGSVIKITHTLNNDTSGGIGYDASHRDGYDYAPITMTFKIHHNTGDAASDARYSETIKVVQYPALYIDAQPNSKPSGARSDGKSDTGDKGHYGGVFINGGSDPGSIFGLTGGNKNPNMFVITSTVLSISGKLGDPRSTTPVTLTGLSSATLPSIYDGTNRKLTTYYTVPSDGSKDDFIAPKFRIASSYGVTNSLSYQNAQIRCATYQEDGYPSGRWRMPTKAEIQYINKLSYDGVFEPLFSSASSYWCANGSVKSGTISNGTSNPTSAYVRCVYDEWYWETTEKPRIPEGQRNTAMWGDAPIN